MSAGRGRTLLPVAWPQGSAPPCAHVHVGDTGPRDHAPTRGETGSAHSGVRCGQGQAKIEAQGSGAAGISGGGLVLSRKLRAPCGPRSWAEPSRTGARPPCPALSETPGPATRWVRWVGSVCLACGRALGLSLGTSRDPGPRPCPRTPALNHCLLGCFPKLPRPRSAAQALARVLTAQPTESPRPPPEVCHSASRPHAPAFNPDVFSGRLRRLRLPL